ncbi:hypothetical protein OKW22_000941 [Bacilli bacterium PM5-3]|nr:hypothetical protein [Bacilli bacterium PM5-3]MDH6604350.1 hypothetical protein [Bacilli bacterium PM5-9]
MNKIVGIFLNNYYLLLAFYVLVALLVIFLIIIIKHNVVGIFHEASIFRRLKNLYKKYDYPYINEIILPINKESYAYYDAIVFGDKFVYLIEIKNHNGNLLIDPLDDWQYIKKNKQSFSFMNPFYELELKKHILNRFMEIDKNRYIEIVVYNNSTIINGKKGKNHLVAANQLNSLIRHYESMDNIQKFSPDFIEKKGNYILGINIKKRSIRKSVISDLKLQHSKR